MVNCNPTCVFSTKKFISHTSRSNIATSLNLPCYSCILSLYWYVSLVMCQMSANHITTTTATSLSHNNSFLNQSQYSRIKFYTDFLLQWTFNCSASCWKATPCTSVCLRSIHKCITYMTKNLITSLLSLCTQKSDLNSR